MSTMHVPVVTRPGALELAELPVPEPGPGEVRIAVRACGVCHSDSLTVENHWPGLVFPRAPGHEIAGVVDAVGAGVTAWKAGDRAGVGWHGGNDMTCRSCLRGDFITCDALRVPGISYDGGYAPYVVVPAMVLAKIPEALSFEDAAPLLCAGITTFNALRRSGAVAGDLVGILGLGGLGHLAVQYAAKMGFEVVAIARGAEKGAFAKRLGAHHYVDSTASDPGAELAARGGARVVLATVTSASAMEPLLGGLGVDGTLIVVGAAPEPLPVVPMTMIQQRRVVMGWPSGTAADSADTLRFSALAGIRPSIEPFPRARARDAYDRMMGGEARFRVVLTD